MGLGCSWQEGIRGWWPWAGHSAEPQERVWPLSLSDYDSLRGASLLAFSFLSGKFFFLKNIYLFIYLAALGLSCGTRDLVPWPGIEPGTLALGARSLNHWTTRESTCLGNSYDQLFLFLAVALRQFITELLVDINILSCTCRHNQWQLKFSTMENITHLPQFMFFEREIPLRSVIRITWLEVRGLPSSIPRKPRSTQRVP